jgi:hypothetical protein
MVTGTLGGKAFVAKDVLSVVTVTAPDSGQPDTVTVEILDYAGACALNPRQSVKAGTNILALHVTGSAPVAPGVYIVPSMATAQFATYDATCNVSGQEALGGSVTVTSADACGLSGTFALRLTSDSVTGSFVAPNCAPIGSSGAHCI